MEYKIGLGLIVVAILQWIVFSIIEMKKDIKRINLNINKIARQIGVFDTMTDELKKLVLEGKNVEAIKKYRDETGATLLEAKQHIDLLEK